MRALESLVIEELADQGGSATRSPPPSRAAALSARRQSPVGPAQPLRARPSADRALVPTPAGGYRSSGLLALAALKSREAELEQLIARAQAALGEDVPLPATPPSRSLTLHEALRTVLTENHNEWMTVDELARAVNDRGLYSKRDGSPVPPSQIHARASSYPDMFEKDGPRVRLKPEAA